MIKLNAEEESRIIRLYQEGWGISAISRFTKRNKMTVSKVLDRNNVPKRKRTKSIGDLVSNPISLRNVKGAEDVIHDTPINYNSAKGRKCFFHTKGKNIPYACDYLAIMGKSRGGDPCECYKYLIKQRGKANA